MVENEDVHIKKIVRRYVSKCRKPRERSACPMCDSLLVKRRKRVHDYICRSCGWEGVAIKKVMW
jgi:ribosomal protein L37AE/L43A